MRAVDTNVLARYYLRDDAAQARAAERILSAGEVYVPKTVVLELEWVLRSVAGQAANKVLDCLGHLIALPGVAIEDYEEVEAALRYCRQGIDFADALHFAACRSCSELLTFDNRGFVQKAARINLMPPVKLAS